MAFDSKGLDDYVDVAQRIADFRERYPEGSLQPLNPAVPYEIRKVAGTAKGGGDFTATFIVYTAVAYRTADDQRPGIGTAWEVFPGRTPYTLGSELMNAETSAWGRAIIAALASDSKRGVSSREEVRNRQAERDDTPAANGHGGPQFPVTDRDTRLIPGRPVTTLGRPAPGTGSDMADEIRTEERPGSADPADLSAIHRAYVKLGFDPRTDALRMAHTTEQLTGRNLAHGPNKGKTHKNLSWPEGKAVRAELEGFKGDRGALLARLSGVTQAAEATAAQDAAEGTQEEIPVPP